MTRLKIIGVGYFLALLFTSCKKTDSVVEPISHSGTSGSFELLQKRVLTPSCAVSGCHASQADNSYNQHKLLLTGANVYKSLVNAPPTNAKAATAGLLQIMPNNFDKSFFYQKLIYAESAHKYGNAMPLGADQLTAKQLQFIRDWITAGAPEKGHVADEELLLH